MVTSETNPARSHGIDVAVGRGGTGVKDGRGVEVGKNVAVGSGVWVGGTCVEVGTGVSVGKLACVSTCAALVDMSATCVCRAIVVAVIRACSMITALCVDT